MDRKVRQSNIELLRIISIFLILVVHADFLILGYPDLDDFKIFPMATITRIFFEMLAIICVNVFVFISGWFSIKFSLKGICKLLFQIFFLQLLVYFILFLCGERSFGVESAFGLFMFDRYFWFVKAYIGLFIFSPVINIFVKHASLKTIAIVLFSYYIFQTIYAWMTDGAWFLNSGYCITSICAIYLMARFIREYINRYGFKSVFSWNKYRYLFLYLILAVVNTICYIMSLKIPGGGYLTGRLVYYTNPIIIVQSICLFMFFQKVKINPNKIINSIAASSFAVFIVHATQGLNYFSYFIKTIYSEFSGIECLVFLFLFLVGIFVLSIVFDYPRKLVWNMLDCHVPNYKLD